MADTFCGTQAKMAVAQLKKLRVSSIQRDKVRGKQCAAEDNLPAKGIVKNCNLHPLYVP
jgi:hypothetical protein